MISKLVTRDGRRLALALGGEGMQSGLHFALNLVLMSILPAREYGAFAFVLVLGGVGLVYVRALTAMPASTYIGRARRAAFADFYEGAFGAAALALSLVIALAAAAVLATWSGDEAASGAVMVGFWSLRSHLRIVGFARRQALAVTLGDAAFAVTGASASALALHFGKNALDGVLLALALAHVVGAMAMALASGRAPRVDFRRRARYFYAGLARRLVWSLYSVTAAALQGQGLAFLVVAFSGPAAFAPIAAMLAFFAPMRILTLSLSNMLQPEVSRVAAAGDEVGWRRMRNAWTLRAVLLGLVYGEMGMFVVPRLHLKSLGHQPLIFIAIMAWTLFAILLGYMMPRLLLETRMRFREIAGITTLSATVSLIATAALLKFASPTYAIIGAMLGEAVAAAATWQAAARPFGGRRRSSAQPASRTDSAPSDGATYKAEPLT